MLNVWFLATFGQKNYSLSLDIHDQKLLLKNISYKTLHPNQESIHKELDKIYQSLISVGYIAASIDSIIYDSLDCRAFISCGEKYKWIKLDYNPSDEPILSRLGYAERLFTDKLFTYKELAKMFDKTITYYENNGYPFASIKLDSLVIFENKISAKLNIQKHQFVKLDSVIIEGNSHTNKKFILRYLNLKEGSPYNEASYLSISKKLRQLPFLIEKKAPVLRLTDKENKLCLFADKKNASQFDGIVGILPGNNGKTIFTGDVKIKLVNGILKSGETFDINWRRLQSQTQDLQAHINYPFLFGFPVGVDYNIKLYRKDTSFIDINNAFAFQYFFSGLNYIKAFYKQRNANIISTSGLTNATVLPDYADVATKSYGLGIGFEKLDYKFNPKKGVSISAQASIGIRTIKRNPKINDAAYSNIALHSGQYQLDGNLAGYINLHKNHVLKLAAQFGSVFGNTIYKNELIRIGGLRTLRGFDEESIYTSTYLIPTLEYRFLFEQNSNLFLFAEGAWYENSSVGTYIHDTPYSVGAGINFETKAGILTLSYALGRQFNNPFDLRTGKIHAGLVALF